MFIEKSTGRNLVNITQIKIMLSQYSEAKKLALEIRHWLQKRFLRWIINYFDHTQIVNNTEQYTSLVHEQVPTWFLKKQAGCRFIYINPQHPELQQILEKLSEWLSSNHPRLAHKFHQMTVPHILAKWQQDHTRIKRQKIKHIETSGDNLIVRFSHKNYSIVEMKANHNELAMEMARESSLMQHCLGEFDDITLAIGGYGEYYYKRIRQKNLRLFSLRDAYNKPHATIALYLSDKQLWVDQIKGKQNAPPINRYVLVIQKFLTLFKVHYDFHTDCLGMGLICKNGESLHVSEIDDENTQQLILAKDPSLIEKIPNPSLSMYWLLSLRNPKHISALNIPNDAMKISALIQLPLLMTELTFKTGFCGKNILTKKHSIGHRLISFIKLQVTRV
ncbi:hypothetical protein MNBD_GAMMA12-2560 [hydrothermal vent metagenome]|uniref:Uncharacterized protein n=1 Tax=hydrothermal vent metagenome TaxID=652676 RepID=A0A3B0Z0B7_9ZZZZ